MKSAILALITFVGGFVQFADSLASAQGTDRAPQERPAAVKVGRGWVIDPNTHLMWATTEERIGLSQDWAVGMLYCEHSRTGGFKDWRLPTTSELVDLY